jgi:hypothetical protein
MEFVNVDNRWKNFEIPMEIDCDSCWKNSDVEMLETMECEHNIRVAITCQYFELELCTLCHKFLLLSLS